MKYNDLKMLRNVPPNCYTLKIFTSIVLLLFFSVNYAQKGIDIKPEGKKSIKLFSGNNKVYYQ